MFYSKICPYNYIYVGTRTSLIQHTLVTIRRVLIMKNINKKKTADSIMMIIWTVSTPKPSLITQYCDPYFTPLITGVS